jgi:AbrB family looped-hinge helix DNA binding protein
MVLAHSRLTAQGQISVPAEVRKRLGIGPGATLEWDEESGQIIVRRAGRYSSEELHGAVLRGHPKKRATLKQLKQGIAACAR